MTTQALLKLLPGLAFFALVHLVIATPIALIFKTKLLAIVVAAAIGTAALNAVAYYWFGHFDLAYVLYVLGVGLPMTVAVTLFIGALGWSGRWNNS